MGVKRLFIESATINNAELNHSKRAVRYILEDQNLSYPDGVFDEIVDFAWKQADRAWEAVKRADEIYGDSSLTPLNGIGSYSGSPVVMDVMMQKTIDENITGKSLFFLRPFDDIDWDEIDTELLKQAFVNNKLFTYETDDNGDSYFDQVNINQF